MSEKIQGIEVEVSVLFKNKSFLKSLDEIQKKLDKMVSSIKNFENAGIKSFGNFERKINTSMKSISKTMQESIIEAGKVTETNYRNNLQQTVKITEKIMKQNGDIIERTVNTQTNNSSQNKSKAVDTTTIHNIKTQENATDIETSDNTADNAKEEKKTESYSESLKKLKETVDTFGSDTFSKMLEPLTNMTDIIDNLKEFGGALKEITTTGGKFDLGKTLKFGAISAGLYILNSLFETFTNYLKDNETAQASWNAIVENGKAILKGVTDIITTVIGVMFGFNKELDGTYKNHDKVNGALEKVKNATESLKEKVEQLQEWVMNNQDTIASWREKLEELLPYIIGLFIIVEITKIISALAAVIKIAEGAVFALDAVMKFMSATNPMVLIIMAIVGVIIALILYLKHLYDTNEEFREKVDNAWKSVKNIIALAVEDALTSFDVFKYALGELAKAWEAFTNKDFKAGKTHLSNIVDKEKINLHVKEQAELRKAQRKKQEAENLAKKAEKNDPKILNNINSQPNINPDAINNIYNGNPKAQKELKKAETLKQQITKEWLDNWNTFIESQSTTIATLTQEWVNFFTSLQILVITSVALMSLPWIMFITNLSTAFSAVILSLSTFWIIFVTNSITYLSLLSSTTILIVESIKFKIFELTNILTLATVIITNNLLLLTASLFPVLTTSQVVIDGIKSKLNELAVSFNNIIQKVQETINKIRELKTTASFGIIINSTVNSGKASNIASHYMGTNHFSGGLTAINEHGDELLLAPDGTVIANNPSTTNIMRDLFLLKNNMSHLNFKMNGNSAAKATNNITINIGNVSNRNDVDYLLDQLSMLDLS
ncbi:MAG: hypothetical protein LBV03_05230 [Fusobacteriales bacterium]|jgi:hypothetical protein|nr:hypothetical protein [Fusobacteriales bacterium]